MATICSTANLFFFMAKPSLSKSRFCRKLTLHLDQKIEVPSTVTPAGVNWIKKKSAAAPIPAEFRARYVGGNLPSPFGMNLDGIQCIDCIIPDLGWFYYNGDADVELIDPVFKGSCKVVLKEGANRKQPEVVRRLISALGNRCTFSGDLPDSLSPEPHPPTPQ
jgi:hypothetical protein